MERFILRDDQWARLEPLCPGKKSDRGVTAKDNRLFLEAVLWVARTGCPWRDLPKEFGHWHRVYVRFSRWVRKKVISRIKKEFLADPDLEMILLDSTIVRVHQHEAGAIKIEGPQAIGRSRGGLTTKIHASVDSLGNPLEMILTGCEKADILQAEELTKGYAMSFVVADKTYDSDKLVKYTQEQGAEAVITPRGNRKNPREYGRYIYKDRNLIERFFNRIKQSRRVATRYEKLDRTFLGFLHLVCAFIWLL